MCTVCGLLEKGENGIVVKRGYKEDNTNRRNPLANDYTPEGRQLQPDAARFEYAAGNNGQYIAPIISIYSSMDRNKVSEQYSPQEEYSPRQDFSGIESLAA